MEDATAMLRHRKGDALAKKAVKKAVTKKVLTRKVMKKAKGGGGIGTTARRPAFVSAVADPEGNFAVTVEGGEAVAASARRRVGP